MRRPVSHRVAQSSIANTSGERRKRLASWPISMPFPMGHRSSFLKQFQLGLREMCSLCEVVSVSECGTV